MGEATQSKASYQQRARSAKAEQILNLHYGVAGQVAVVRALLDIHHYCEVNKIDFYDSDKLAGQFLRHER